MKEKRLQREERQGKDLDGSRRKKEKEEEKRKRREAHEERGKAEWSHECGEDIKREQKAGGRVKLQSHEAREGGKGRARS